MELVERMIKLNKELKPYIKIFKERHIKILIEGIKYNKKRLKKLNNIVKMYNKVWDKLDNKEEEDLYYNNENYNKEEEIDWCIETIVHKEDQIKECKKYIKRYTFYKSLLN